MPKTSQIAIEHLGIPLPAYLGILIKNKTFTIAEVGGENVYIHQPVAVYSKLSSSILRFINKHGEKRNVKYVAATLADHLNYNDLFSKLWKRFDIVPILGHQLHFSPTQLASFTSHHFEGNIFKVRLTAQNEVIPQPLVDLDEYARYSDPESFQKLKALSKKFSGKRISFISATPRGGGVAIMRHALLRLFSLLGVDSHWYVLEPRKEAFEITKEKFHNVLQHESKASLTHSDIEVYKAWIQENAILFQSAFAKSDVIVIDDPQPAGLIPYIKKINPNAFCIYRSHIHMDTEHMFDRNSPSAATWEFLWQSIKDADLFVSHPVVSFVPPHVSFEKVVFMPATSDVFDGLNKPLLPSQRNYYLKLFDKYLLETGQTPIDRSRPYLVQIARFDPAKGIPDVLESYRMLRHSHSQIRPQLVIAGNGSIDDPDGDPLFHLTLETIRSARFSDLTHDIKIALLPHIDQILNTLVRESYAVLQLSHQDGFEVKVTEALMKGKPVIAYKTGGIQLQLVSGLDGFLVEPVGNIDGVVRSLWRLFADKKLYRSFCRQAKKHYRRDVDTVHNALSWLYLANKLMEKRTFTTNGSDIRSLLSATP
ncbi:glycosyltransferase [Candidatus Gottesmanbacteria bacterium]|nr:glycosyltransferase [Candidatus Gottesmanbacteria bacterium]